VPRLDPSTGLTRLVTVRVSRAAADQRAGRAGREAPGVASRLWTPAQHRGLAPYDRPDILEAELSSLVLDCAAWGTPPAELKFLDQPPAGALTAANALLTELGALTGGKITPAGQRMASLGAHPRLAAMMLAAETAPEQALAADLAALLEERDPLRTSRGPRDPPADIGLRLLAIRHGDPEADRGALSAIRRTAAQYRRRLRLPADIEADGDPGRLLAAAFPDRIGQRRGEPGSFRFAGGGGGRMPGTDKLANTPLLVAAALDVKSGAHIRLAAALDPGSLPASVAARVTEQVEAGFDPVSGSVLARRRRRLGALVLSDRTVPVDPAEVAGLLADTVAEQRLKPLKPGKDVEQFRARVALMRGIEPDAEWPDLSDEALIATVRDWLAPHLHGMARLADLDRLDLAAILRGLLPWNLATRLDQALPTHLTLPHGRAPVNYAEPVPVAEARAQAFYGMTTTPLLAGGRVPLRLALLSPAGRPIAVTADLANFWRGAWADARRDMRGRYPKHDWPEDGGAA
jgi:ATP-dependent helicase HrpB